MKILIAAILLTLTATTATAQSAYHTTCENGFGQRIVISGYGCPPGFWQVN